MTNRLIAIVGPTASGKSDLALTIAENLSSEIVSCDSMQIYRGMDIGTAKESERTRRGIPHHMIDIVDPTESFSVSQYADQALSAISQIHRQDKIPIVAGGTGLYLDSLIYPLTFGQYYDPAVRNRLQKELELYGALEMHRRLVNIDASEAEKIHPNNTKRVLRALELYESGGILKSSLSDKQRSLRFDTLLIVPQWERAELYRRIDLRVDRMIEAGLAAEIKRLLHNGVDWNCQSMQAIGYKEFRPYFDNSAPLAEVVAQIKLNSRHYAKRQIGWFQRYSFAKFYHPLDQTDRIAQEVDRFIHGDNEEKS